MKSTMQTFRDLPNYPAFFVKGVTYWLIFYGVASLVLGVPLLLASFRSPLPSSINTILVPLGAFFGSLHGFGSVFVLNWHSQLSSPDISPTLGLQTFQLYGGIFVFWGVAHLWTAWKLSSGARKTAALMQGVWVIYGGLIIAFLELGSQFFGIRLGVEPLSVLFFFVIPLFIVSLLMFDERIKAYFGEGRFAESYRRYVNLNWSGQTEALSSPWAAGTKE